MRLRAASSLLAVFLTLASVHAWAQFPGQINPAAGRGFGNNGALGNGPPQGQGQGGGANADFDGLIDLIVSTVASETWAENGGGEAEIRPFAGGVYADAHGTLRQLKQAEQPDARSSLSSDLTRLKATAQPRPNSKNQTRSARQESQLRCVSLRRLEEELSKRIANRKPLDQEMLTLAGLRRIQYVFVYPPTKDNPRGDVAIAGPAGDWQVSDERRIVSKETAQPVVRLDDLLTLLRRNPGNAFGCSIDPRPESLAAAQQYLSAHSIPRSRRGRDKWLEEVRGRVGVQDLRYMGLTGTSRIACVLGEADYHMKLVGMGMADGVAGMQSYLESIKVKPGQEAPGLGAVRWWFGMNYAAIESAESGDAFHIVGPGVKLLSENEALEAQGQRRPTGKSDEFALSFASSFTKNFSALCEKYPVYAELRNVFDLSLVVALVQSEGLAQKAGWSPTLLRDAKRLPLPKYKAPTTVDTVANLRVVDRRHVFASVSGGVWAQPTNVLKTRVRKANAGAMSSQRGTAPSTEQGWWWDAR